MMIDGSTMSKGSDRRPGTSRIFATSGFGGSYLSETVDIEKAALGFEPRMGFPNGFAIRPIRPLWHAADP